MKRIIYLALMTMLTVSTTTQLVSALPLSDKAVRQQLLSEMEANLNIEPSVEIRISLVRGFVKEMTKLDDLQLGEPDINPEQAKGDLEALEEKVSELVRDYKQQVKPILLNNIKLKRADAGAVQNKGELIQISFLTTYNHRSGKPISGLLHYKKDVSSSFFSEDIVDAGLLVNFPELEQAAWLQAALQMEAELTTLRLMHRENFDGNVYTEKKKQRKSALTVDSTSEPTQKVKPASSIVVVAPVTLVAPEASSIVIGKTKESVPQVVEKPVAQREVLSEHERTSLLRKFSESLRKLRSEQGLDRFKQDMLVILDMYEQQVKAVLVDNINLQRVGAAALSNKGDLHILFFENRNNHYTASPVLGKLRYKKDVSDSFFSTKIEDVGLLVDNPRLEQEDFIQAALKMEEELAVLLQEHRDYLEGGF